MDDTEVDVTSLTLATLAVIAYGLMNRRGYGRALALAGATPAGAALVVSAFAVPTFYAVAAGTVILIGLSRKGVRDAPQPARPVPGAAPLIALVVIGVVVTLTAPILFDGLPVLTSSGSGAALEAGSITKSNIAQFGYLAIGVVTFFYLARSPHTGAEVVGIAACLATTLSFWAWAHQVIDAPFPEGFFDNSPFFRFQNTLPGGEPRVRGIFSEPAALATSSLVTMAYTASRARSLEGWHRAILLTSFAAAATLGFVSTSATFVVAGSLIGLAALAATAIRFLRNRQQLSTMSVIGLGGLAALAAWQVIPLLVALSDRVNRKLSSSSYSDRSGADEFSYDLVMRTLGLGVGLGSNRASSFPASLLSTVGIAGGVALAMAVYLTCRTSKSVPEAKPVIWALAALLVCKTISGPDLSETSGLLWTSLGVLAHFAWRVPGRPAGTPPLAVPDQTRAKTYLDTSPPGRRALKSENTSVPNLEAHPNPHQGEAPTEQGPR